MRVFIKFLVRNIPRHWLIRFSYIFSGIIAWFYKGDTHYCPVCGGKFSKMLPYGNNAGVNRLCPKCLSLERHRLLWMYFKEKTNLFTENLKVLHVAPEQPFVGRFRKMKNLDYTTADLVSPLADVKLDIQNMPFEDNTFDVFICNHVLEHVPDELKALSEVKRILKPGGWAILQVPINYSLETTYEDSSITDPKEREKHFGQYDHLRYHGLDYQQRLEKGGFKVIAEKFYAQFDATQTEYMRLSKFGENEVIFKCVKE